MDKSEVKRLLKLRSVQEVIDRLQAEVEEIEYLVCIVLLPSENENNEINVYNNGMSMGLVNFSLDLAKQILFDDYWEAYEEEP